MNASIQATATHAEFTDRAQHAIADQVAKVLGRGLELEPAEGVLAFNAPLMSDSIHIEFRFAVQVGDTVKRGAWLVPFPDAVTFAAEFLMMTDEEIAVQRAATELDESLKAALLELANFVGYGVEDVYRELVPEVIKARSEGCRGVRANGLPRIEPRDEALLVSKPRFEIGGFDEFESLLLLPIFD